ncbi:unnamed protein product [Phytophthora fragariaefolia]|uniref:Unnamed protein product n=1 Tax=Phytophthora fragariaefolia TaxID=1490495 RepID=A0A9W6TW44_9STRA|nr:unnamed protein product [Phytophthora fragariaefolia]
MARINKEGLDLQDINGAQQRPALLTFIVVTDSTVSVVTEPPVDLSKNTAEVVPDEPMDVAENPDRDAPEATVATVHAVEPVVTEVQNTPRRLTEIPAAVPLDDFDSDDFLDAMCRDRLCTPAYADDLSIGDADWLLSLDSDDEGDGDTILLDEGEDTEEDGSVVVETDESNHDGVDEEEVLLEFDLSEDELDHLQSGGWDTFDEHHSNQVLHDAAPLWRECWHVGRSGSSSVGTASMTLLAFGTSTTTPNRPKAVIVRLRFVSLSRHSRRRFYEGIDSEVGAPLMKVWSPCVTDANEKEDAVAQRVVVKNLGHVLGGQPTQRLVGTDNFYTSLPLSLKLFGMGYSHVGTIRKDRKGWYTAIEFTQKKCPKRKQRGTYRIGVWRDHPEVVAVAWMENKPVRFLGTGCSTQ